MRARDFIIEYVAPAEITEFRNFIDSLFINKGITIQFDAHVFNRLNHDRNNSSQFPTGITIEHLKKMFSLIARDHIFSIKSVKLGNEAVFKYTTVGVSIPFVVTKKQEVTDDDDGRPVTKITMTILLKTAIRKNHFDTPNAVFRVRDKGMTESAESFTPQFKSWFGNSIVKDSSGNPLAMYHGTAGDISEFTGFVNWFSASPKFASEYADLRDLNAGSGGNVVKAYIKAERPFDADRLSKGANTVAEFVMEMVRQADERGINFNEKVVRHLLDIVRRSAREEESGPHYSAHDFWFNTNSSFGNSGTDAIRELFKLFGFDSIKYTEDGEYTIGVFRSNQIKSAISNVGIYDPTSGNVMKEGYK